MIYELRLNAPTDSEKPQEVSNFDMCKSLTLGSLFSGSGGFELGGMLAGIEPKWASEIAPFPIRVTTKRLPQVRHLGDINAIDGGNIEPVDVITFGSPCTNLSIAGNRAGLQGEQSSLFFEAIRVIREMRCATNGKYPRFIVFENVTGVFSSSGGRDFRSVLTEVVRIREPEAPEVPLPETGGWPPADVLMGDGWSVAYRTLDAQHFGVAQRRRRIYLVADFDGGCAGKVLFESEGVSGYSTARFRAWQDAARSSADRSGASGGAGRPRICLNDQGGQRMDVTDDRTNTLRAASEHPPLVFDNHSQDSRYAGPTETSQTLTSMLGTGGNSTPLAVGRPRTFKVRCGCGGGGKGALVQDNISATISCNNDQTLFEPRNWDGGSVAGTLTANSAGGEQRMPDKGNFHCVIQAYGISSFESKGMLSGNPKAGVYKTDTARTIDANGGSPSCHQGGVAVVEKSCALQGAMIGRKEKNGLPGDSANEEVGFSLTAADRHAVYAVTTGSFTEVGEENSPTITSRDYKSPNSVCLGIGRDTFNQGMNAQFAPSIGKELQPPLIAKGPGAVQWGYAVRRLTPTEYARLQGFSDWWCDGLETDDPTEEEMAFWRDVFETYRRIVSHAQKPKTDRQIRKWLASPHSDGAEYKMWGNGVALPCVWFVLAGIAYYAARPFEKLIYK